MRAPRRFVCLPLLLLLGASDPARAALHRYALLRTTVELSRTGYGPSGYGIFSLAEAGLVQVARIGDPEPGGNGVFASLDPVIFGAAGHVAFGATLSGTSGGSGDDAALYRSDASGAVLIAREGQSVPGGVATFADMTPLFVDSAGFVFFRSRLSGFVGLANDSGLFRGDGASLVTIAREGDSAFGAAEFIGDLSSTFVWAVPAGAGAAAFWCHLIGGGVSDTDDSTLILRGAPAETTRICPVCPWCAKAIVVGGTPRGTLSCAENLVHRPSGVGKTRMRPFGNSFPLERTPSARKERRASSFGTASAKRLS